MARLVGKDGVKAGESIKLSRALTLGRSLSADLRLDDLAVSREHARVVKTKSGDYVVEDLDSGNGTFLNEERVHSATLKHGDTLQIGSNIFEFQEDEDESGVSRDTNVLSEDRETSVISTVRMDSKEARQETAGDTVEQLKQANQRFRIIYDIIRSIGANLQEREILPKILDKLFDAFPGTQRGFIILRDPDTGRLTPRASKTLKDDDDSELALSETILQFVLDKRQAVLSRDAMHDTRFAGSESIMDFEMRSVMCAPLKHNEEVLGFIMLDTPRVSPSYDEEGLTLLAGIANQASMLVANARMHSQLVKRERLEQDMRNASRIQHSFLPQAPPKKNGYEFVDWYDTALEVGGDFYDFIELPEDKLVIVVGDVSGKGVPAALMMAKATGNARFHAASGLSPAHITQKLNDTVAAGNTEMFITGLVISLDCKTRELRMVNAGHPPPLLKKADGSVEEVNSNTGFPIGVVEGAEFPERTFSMEPSERLCLFTDGITEAMTEDKECFGEERLQETLVNSTNSAEQIVEDIQRAIAQHVGPAAQSDDLTLICFGPTDEAGSEDESTGE